MSKKGFTLIEVVVSLAILAISMVGISVAMVTSAKMQKLGEVKVNTMNYAQGIAEILKRSDLNNIVSKMYDPSYTTSSYYRYIDDDLTAFITWLNEPMKTINTTPFGSYTKVGNEKYGIYIKVNKDLTIPIPTDTSYNYYTYHVNIVVWNQYYGASSQSVSDVFISR